MSDVVRGLSLEVLASELSEAAKVLNRWALTFSKSVPGEHYPVSSDAPLVDFYQLFYGEMLFVSEKLKSLAVYSVPRE